MSPVATTPETAPTEAEPTDNAAAILAYAQLQDAGTLDSLRMPRWEKLPA